MGKNETNELIFQKLSIENFMMHRNTEIDLGNSIILITGANGSGKTQILEALLLSMGHQSQRLKRVRAEELIGHFDRKAHIRLTIKIPSAIKEKLLTSLDDFWRPYIIQEDMVISIEISEKYGFKYMIENPSRRHVIRRGDLRNFFSQLMIHPDNRLSFTEEGAIHAFCYESPRNKLELLLRLSNLMELRDTLSKSLENVRNAYSMQEPLRAKLARDREYLNELEKNMDKLKSSDELNRKIKILEKASVLSKKNELEREIKSHNQQIEIIEKELEYLNLEVREHEKKLDLIKLDFEKADEEKEKVNQSINNLRSRQGEIHATKKLHFDQIDRNRDRIATLERKKNEINELLGSAIQKQQKQADLESRIMEIKAAHEKLSKTLETEWKAVEKHGKDCCKSNNKNHLLCKICFHNINSGKDIILNLDSNDFYSNSLSLIPPLLDSDKMTILFPRIAKFEKTIDDIKNLYADHTQVKRDKECQICMHQQYIDRIKEYESDIKTIDSDIDDLEKNIVKLENEIKAVSKEMDKISGDFEKKDIQLSDIKSSIDRILREKTDMEKNYYEKESRYKDQKSRLNFYREKIGNTNQLLEPLLKLIGDMEMTQEIEDEAARDHDEINSEIDKLKGRLEGLGMFQVSTEAYEMQKEKVQKLEEEISGSKSHLDNLKADIELRMELWNTQLENLINTLHGFMNTLSDKFFDKMQLKINNVLDIENAGLAMEFFRSGGGPFDLSSLSGGEKIIAVLSLILSFHLMADSPIHVIDEFTQKMDIESKRRALKMVLHSLKLTESNSSIPVSTQFILICPDMLGTDLEKFPQIHQIVLSTILHKSIDKEESKVQQEILF